MKPAESKHIIKTIKNGSKRGKTTETDLRQSSWRKINGTWVNNENLRPANKESINKIEQWVKEITRISPLLSETESEVAPDQIEILDHQLSAVEGHKKIELIEAKDTKKDAEVEHPENEEEDPLGIELESQPWIKKAKIVATTLSIMAISLLLLVGNKMRESKEHSILSSTSQSDEHKGGFSEPLIIKGVGVVYLYNQDWDLSGKNKGAIEDLIKPLSIQLIGAHSNLKFKEIRLTKETIRQRVSAIDEEKIPMLVMIPEGKTKKSNNTKIWISKKGRIFIERTRNNKTTWKLVRLPEDQHDKLSIPILED